MDLQNAFDMISRASFRKEVHICLPQLHNWVEYCYGPGNEPELWVNEYRLLSVCGDQRGDPLGPLLFSLALHPILERLAQKINEWHQELDIMSDAQEPSPLCFYLDDGVSSVATRYSNGRSTSSALTKPGNTDCTCA